MTGKCELCKKDAALAISHFIPSFIGKWFKKTSITGYLRESSNVSLRQQDLIKEYLLCNECEALFSGWEKSFAEKVFFPYVENKVQIIAYQDWLLKFCVSLSWRTLIYIRKINAHKNEDIEYLESIKHGKEVMENFLLGKKESIFDCEQHLFPLDEIASTTMMNLPTNINRYLLRTFGMDIIGNKNNIFVYTKLPCFMLLGVIKTNENKNMTASKIKMRKGVLSPRNYMMPKGIHSYFIAKAIQMEELDSKIPKHQQESIEAYLKNNPEKAANSKTIEAFQADLRLFGNRAFKKNE